MYVIKVILLNTNWLHQKTINKLFLTNDYYQKN